jgi:glutamate/aspartate transport system ATP-binding protein
MIHLSKVNKSYGAVKVLIDCSLTVKKGEVVVICGPSGSGKSTLIKTLNALEPIQSGEIMYEWFVSA